MHRRALRTALAAVLAQAAVVSSPAAAQQAVDTAYARMVREATTDPRFLPATVATLPASADVPTPLEHFGFMAGAPGVMHHTDELYGYFRALADASPRVRVETLGTTEEGRDILLVVIADEAGLARSEHFKAQGALLADPRALGADRVDAVLDDARPIYYLNGGLHSPEMGSPEMLMELAYRLAVSEDPTIRRIRENLIVLINPVSEPDGRDKQVDWYRAYTKGRTEWDDGFPRSVPYWGRYVVHDNNRDGIQVSQALTKAISRAYFDWHPVVMHDLHESVPLLYVSTGTGPYNATADPIAISEWQLLANADVTALSAQGQPGVWTWGFFDGWWPGYAIWVANNHNAVGRFYETFGNAGADTYVRDLSRARYAGEPATERTWYRPWPPTQKVRWSLRNNTNYMQAGVLASLGFVADNPRLFLRNFWQKGVNSLERGRTETPHAYVIPGFQRQRDPKAAAYLVNQLLRQRIEVHRAGRDLPPAAPVSAEARLATDAAAPDEDAPGETAGDEGPRDEGTPDEPAGNEGAPAEATPDTLSPRAGDFVVRLDQPYRDLAVNLLSLQRFPQDADHPPYDDIAWTLGYLYGVDVRAVDDSAALAWEGLEPVADTVAAVGAVSGKGEVWALPYRAQSEVLSGLYALREGSSRARVSAAEEAFLVGADSFPAGSLLLERLTAAEARELADRFAFELTALAALPEVPRHPVDLPRVGLYHTWYYTQDEGWARYTFEQRGIPYTSIDKDDLRRGGLRERFDVIVVPAIGGSVEQMIHGIDRKWSPLPYRRSERTPHLGTPDETGDMTGGPGFEGMAQLQRFVESGGTLVTLEDATRLAAETGIARALSPKSAGNLFHPGSVVRARAARPGHPVLYGYPERTTVFRGNAALYEIPSRDSALVVLRYGARPPRRPAQEGPMLGMPETRAPKPDNTQAAVSDSAGGERAAAREGEGGEAYVVSGMVRNESQIVGEGAVFDVPVGQGRVIAFTFNPLHRFLNHHEFPLVWNALMHWNDRPDSSP